MERPLAAPCLGLLALALLAPALPAPVRADDHVAVVAYAEDAYVKRKFGHGEPARESYIVMQGRFHSSVCVDGSLDNMPFREVVSFLVPRLRQQNFVPAKTIPEADLMLVVHWGATSPRIDVYTLMGRTTWKPVESTYTPRGADDPISPDDPTGGQGYNDEEWFERYGGADERRAEFERLGEVAAEENARNDVSQLLGYTTTMRKLKDHSLLTTQEQTLNSDLSSERYFIIVKAYDLHVGPDGKPKQVWALYANIRGPGNNFQTALGRMSGAASSYFGHATQDVETVRPGRELNAKVEIGEMVILGMEPVKK